MTQHLFDTSSDEDFMRKVDSMLKQHRADIQRLWRRESQRPQEFMGDRPHDVNAFGTTTTTAFGTTTTTAGA